MKASETKQNTPYVISRSKGKENCSTWRGGRKTLIIITVISAIYQRPPQQAPDNITHGAAVQEIAANWEKQTDNNTKRKPNYFFSCRVAYVIFISQTVFKSCQTVGFRSIFSTNTRDVLPGMANFHTFKQYSICVHYV